MNRTSQHMAYAMNPANVEEPVPPRPDCDPPSRDLDPLDPYGTNAACLDTDRECSPRCDDTNSLIQGLGFNRYTILSDVPPTAGGMGVVWPAQDNTLHRRVALKQLLPEYADLPYCRNRFRQEAVINAYLDRNLGVIPVHDAGEFPNGRPFFTMPLLLSFYPRPPIESLDPNNMGWNPLSSTIRRYHVALEADEPKLNTAGVLRQFVRCLAFACRALHSVHRQGIVHLDIKPANIIQPEHRSGSWIIDWGMAACLGDFDPTCDTSSRERTRLRVDWNLLVPNRPLDFQRQLDRRGFGTSSYLPPELANGEFDSVGVATDVFGLGAVLYAILTGRQPYVADSVDEALELARRAFVPAICIDKFLRQTAKAHDRRLKTGLDKLVNTCKRALERQPQNRFESAKAMARELECAVDSWRSNES